MPQYFKISQRRLLFFFQDVRTRFRRMLSIDSDHPKKVVSMPPDSVVTIRRIRWSACIGILGHHDPEHATYRQQLDMVRSYLATFRNLQTIGRAGMHRYNNMDHSMLTGILAAKNVLGETHDLWDVNADQTYHESHPPAID